MARANYYLKNSDASRMYRIDYETDLDGRTGAIGIHGCYACGDEATTPNLNSITRVDEPIEASQVLVDVIVNSLVEGTVTEYRTLAKTMTDGFWS